MALLEVVSAPREALISSAKGSWLAAMFALLVLVIVGGTIQAPINHLQNAVAVQEAVSHGSLSSAQQQAIIVQAANPPYGGDLLNFSIYFVIMVFGVAAEAGLAAAFAAFANGTPNYNRLFTATMYISVWAVGVYYLLMSVIMRLAFVQNPTGVGLDAVFPSALMAFPGVTSSFGRGALASVNPFLFGGMWLHAVMMQFVGGVAQRDAYAFASVLLIVEVLATGALVAVVG